jgi:ribonuclease HI
MFESMDPGEQNIVRNLHLDGNNQRGTLGKQVCHGKQHVCREGRWSTIGRGNDESEVFIISSYRGQHSNNLMEALAIKMAMERGCSLGWKKIICDSDS